MMQNIGSPLDLARRLKDICFFAQFSGCRRRSRCRAAKVNASLKISRRLRRAQQRLL
jgi:hypothetical protein